jgi:L-alanine-DL-glutamate epimerase-like enolase superfamily enzyme
MKIEIIPKTLHFKQPAGTSRGVYTTRKVWFIVLKDENNTQHYGVGECAPLPALSCDDIPEYEDILKETCLRLKENKCI